MTKLTDESVLHEMVKFLSSSKRAAWIYGDYMHIFVRKSKRFIRHETTILENCFDLANINVEEEHQGKGIFSDVLVQFVHEFPHLNIYIESIINPSIEHICRKHGFVEINSNSECKNMVRIGS